MVSAGVFRKKPRKAAPGLTFFNKQGLPISVSNAPNVRRIRKQAKRRR